MKLKNILQEIVSKKRLLDALKLIKYRNVKYDKGVQNGQVKSTISGFANSSFGNVEFQMDSENIKMSFEKPTGTEFAMNRLSKNGFQCKRIDQVTLEIS